MRRNSPFIAAGLALTVLAAAAPARAGDPPFPFKQVVLDKAFSGKLTAVWRRANRHVEWSAAEARLIEERRDAYLSSRRVPV